MQAGRDQGGQGEGEVGDQDWPKRGGKVGVHGGDGGDSDGGGGGGGGEGNKRKGWFNLRGRLALCAEIRTISVEVQRLGLLYPRPARGH